MSSDRSALRKSAVGIAFSAAMMSVALALPALSLGNGVGWLYIADFTLGSIVSTLAIARVSPALLERRLRSGPGAEPRRTQKIIQAITGIGFVACFIIAGFDFGHGWSQVPTALIVFGHLLTWLAFWRFFVVFRENAFAATTVQVEAGQTLIDTGPYARVRHPMYAGSLPMFLGMPLGLGSWWAFVAVAVVLVGLMARILDEERVLVAELPGYDDYRRRVRWRLVPGVW